MCSCAVNVRSVCIHAWNICALGEGDFTLQEKAATSIQHNAKRKKKHKHKRKRDGELHAFFPLKNTLLMWISYTERSTEAERAEVENSPASQWLQGPQLISLSSEILVPLTTVNPQQISLRSMNNNVPLRMVKKYVFMCSKHEECLYTCMKHMYIRWRWFHTARSLSSCSNLLCKHWLLHQMKP